MNKLFCYKFIIHKFTRQNNFKLIPSISMMFFFSACTNHAPAPIENTTVIGSQHQQVQTQIYTKKDTHSKERPYSSFNGYICEDTPIYLGKSIGGGECVDLIRLCSSAPLTRFWKPGDHVFGNDVPMGTAIATFRKGKYPNKSGYHAAIYSHQDNNGIYVWDQWKGKAVHLRYILAHQKHKDAGNNASHYRIIKQF